MVVIRFSVWLFRRTLQFLLLCAKEKPRLNLIVNVSFKVM